MLLASMALVACKKETDFTVVNATAWVGEPVVIKDNSEKYKKNTAVFYDFGDGSSTNIGDESRIAQINPTHTYNKPGVYTITQQVMKSRNIEKRSGKTYAGSQTVTIQMVTPTMELSSTAVNTDQGIWIKNTTDESANLGSTPSYQYWVETPTGTQWVGSANDTRPISWTASTSGAHKMIMYAFQGQGRAMISADFTVSGDRADGVAQLLNGKWSVAATASLTGASYGAGCLAATYAPMYSSISLNNDGNIYSGVWANKGGASSTTVAGNVEESLGSIYVTDAGLVNVSFNNKGITTEQNGLFVNTSTTASNYNTGANGLYTIKSSSATSIVLEKVTKGDSFCTAAADTYNDTYTITLTK